MNSVYVVRENNTLFRAFSSQQEAIQYKQFKMNALHEHCCVCQDCPNINYYAEHDHYKYHWDIDLIPVDSPKLQNELFVACHGRTLEQGFASYKEARAYVTNIHEDNWSIVICRYSSTYHKDESYADDAYFHSRHKGKDIINII